MSYTAREFFHAAKKWLVLLLQKYRGKPCFRLNSTIRHKTGIHVLWENGVDYPTVSPGAHPLAKKPEDSARSPYLQKGLFFPCYVAGQKDRGSPTRDCRESVDGNAMVAHIG